MSKEEAIKKVIRDNYAQVAEKGSIGGCCSGDCGCTGIPDLSKTATQLGYTESELAQVPESANMGLGCGNPVALASLNPGEIVLDLGSGGGLDCFLASKHVGESGFVIGVDMTAEMVALARKNAQTSGISNVEFRLGEIEHLPVADATVDVIISNCVINLAADKEQVFREAYRVLRSGGRLLISDVVAIAEIPESIRNDMQLIAGCVGGAEAEATIRAMLVNAGFTAISMMPKENSKDIVKTWAPGRNIEDLLASFIIEAKK